jgi:hypothetical protein
MAKRVRQKGFIADCRHESSSDAHPVFFPTYEEAVDEVHEHFLSYDFEIRDGLPYDPGHEGDSRNPNSAFDCFDDVEMYNGKVASFTHCGGDGPVATIYEQ